jgi:cation diffusion facilitator family transporter
MTGYILKKLIPEGQEADCEAVRSAVGAFSGGVGIAANLVLFLGKLLAGMLSGSVSIVADALNNLSDASGSILTLVGFRLAGKPADAHHPFGHARFEYLSGLAVSVMILVMGLELGKSAVQKILAPAPVDFSGLTAVILVASVAAKLWLWRLNTRLGKQIRSGTLLAAGLDSRNDCISTAAVLAAGLLEHFWDLRVDGIMGLGVAVFILYSGWKLAKETVSPLLGESADPVLRQKIVEYVCSRPKVMGYHDLMVHDYGPGRQYASLHVEMDYREDPLLCHEIIDRMEWECEKNLGVRMVIHYDPVITDDPELTSLRNQVNELLYVRDYRLRQHDLRVVPGRSHRNLVFDVALPSDLRGQEEQIRQEIEDALNREESGTYHVRITYDIGDA